MKMFDNLPTNLIVAINYEQYVMGLMCVLPMLGGVQSLSILVQNINCFICDFMVRMKQIQVDFYNFYVDLEQHFSHDQFQNIFTSILSQANSTIWQITCALTISCFT
jgi:hypothetical protein